MSDISFWSNFFTINTTYKGLFTESFQCYLYQLYRLMFVHDIYNLKPLSIALTCKSYIDQTTDWPSTQWSGCRCAWSRPPGDYKYKLTSIAPNSVIKNLISQRFLVTKSYQLVWGSYEGFTGTEVSPMFCHYSVLQCEVWSNRRASHLLHSLNDNASQ